MTTKPSKKTWSSRRLKLPLRLYRVVGQSMQPGLRPDSIVLATHFYKTLAPEHVVVVRHQGLDKIKRIQKINNDRIFVVGDNARASLDSRTFGWLPIKNVVAKVIWPRLD